MLVMVTKMLMFVRYPTLKLAKTHGWLFIIICHLENCIFMMEEGEGLVYCNIIHTSINIYIYIYIYILYVCMYIYLLPIAIAPGGGRAGAIYNVTSFLSSVNISCSNSDYLEALYRNYTYGHAFEINSEEADGIIDTQIYAHSAGPGADYNEIDVTSSSHPAELISYGFGGLDCSMNVYTAKPLPFPNTHGGFGGGGGGCNGWGGGGGYTGGSIITDGAAIAGEGGYSWPNPPWPFVDYNDGDGYVELFLESCGCTHNRIIYNSSFECFCPSDTRTSSQWL